MRKLGLLETNLTKVTQLAIMISIPEILIAIVIHIIYPSLLPLTDVISIKNDGPIQYIYHITCMAFTKYRDTYGDRLLLIRFWELGSGFSLFLPGEVRWKFDKRVDTKK